MEHMKAKGISAEKLGGRLGIARESVYRAIKNPGSIWRDIAAWAEALDMDHWQDLTRPPDEPSVDARLQELPEEWRRSLFRAIGKG
jgi:hypothetical protein